MIYVQFSHRELHLFFFFSMYVPTPGCRYLLNNSMPSYLVQCSNIVSLLSFWYLHLSFLWATHIASYFSRSPRCYLMLCYLMPVCLFYSTHMVYPFAHRNCILATYLIMSLNLLRLLISPFRILFWKKVPNMFCSIALCVVMRWFAKVLVRYVVSSPYRQDATVIHLSFKLIIF